MNYVLKKYKIDYIFPAYDDVVLFLSEHRKEIDAVVLLPGDDVCKISRFKSLTYEALEGESFCPDVFQSSDNVANWPVFSKPDQGQGTQGIKSIADADDFQQFWPTIPDIFFANFCRAKNSLSTVFLIGMESTYS